MRSGLNESGFSSNELRERKRDTGRDSRPPKKTTRLRMLLRKSKRPVDFSPYVERRVGVKGFVSFEKMLGRRETRNAEKEKGLSWERENFDWDKRERCKSKSPEREPFGLTTKRPELWRISPYGQDYDIQKAVDKFKFAKHSSEVRFEVLGDTSL